MKTQKKTPFQKIQQNILEKAILPVELVPLLPRGWKRVGEIGILDLDSKLLPWKQEIGTIYLNHISELRTIVLKAGATTNSIRKPNYEILAGERNPTTLHKELGCKFWINALNLVFSSGNHAERLHLTQITQENEKIIDMFACVGNLSIPIAVHNPATKIIAIEINPEAFQYLQQNIRENNIADRYKAILGDNRAKTPINWADRVLMGYFGIDDKQLMAAIKSLNQSKGGIIHAHGLSSSRRQNDWKQKVESILDESFKHLNIISNKRRIIKTVAAGINHFVNDIELNSSKLTIHSSK